MLTAQSKEFLYYFTPPGISIDFITLFDVVARRWNANSTQPDNAYRLPHTFLSLLVLRGSFGPISSAQLPSPSA
jgi:hypothetical protein